MRRTIDMAAAGPATAVCPRCGTGGMRRHSYARARLVPGLGGRRHAVRLARHWCAVCGRHFTLRPAGMRLVRRYADEVVLAALALWRETGSVTAAARLLADRHGARVPVTTLHDWIAREHEFTEAAGGRPR